MLVLSFFIESEFLKSTVTQRNCLERENLKKKKKNKKKLKRRKKSAEDQP